MFEHKEIKTLKNLQRCLEYQEVIDLKIPYLFCKFSQVCYEFFLKDLGLFEPLKLSPHESTLPLSPLGK